MIPTQYFRLIVNGVLGTVSRGRYLHSQRTISTTPVLLANYYQVLGIPQSATQGDIKAAYYKLSMLYHPDKNKDNLQAVEKFRAITEAYEVLGNFRLRRLYDKGIIHTAGSQFSHMKPGYDEDEKTREAEPDDAQTKFYKAHMKKSRVPTASGRTPIYDFDEWSRAHYGMSFERRKAAKEKFDRQGDKTKHDTAAFEMEVLLCGCAIFAAVFTLYLMNQQGLDVVSGKKVDKPTDVDNKINDKSEAKK